MIEKTETNLSKFYNSSCPINKQYDNASTLTNQIVKYKYFRVNIPYMKPKSFIRLTKVK